MSPFIALAFGLFGVVAIWCCLWGGIYYNRDSLMVLLFWVFVGLIGWVSIICGILWWLIITENASVFGGHDGASAPTYGRAAAIIVIEGLEFVIPAFEGA